MPDLTKEQNSDTLEHGEYLIAHWNDMFCALQTRGRSILAMGCAQGDIAAVYWIRHNIRKVGYRRLCQKSVFRALGRGRSAC